MWGGTGSDLVPSSPCPLLLERVPPQRRVWRGPLTVKTGLGPLGERVFPHPSGPLALPPSPWGKVASGGGFHTLSWERVAGPEALTGVGRYRV